MSMKKIVKTTSPYVLAKNLRRLMSESSVLRTQNEVGAASGVAQTSVSLMMRPDARAITKSGKAPSPKLVEVERVARAFGLEVWQLLIDEETLSETVAHALSRPAAIGPREGADRPELVTSRKESGRPARS